MSPGPNDREHAPESGMTLERFAELAETWGGDFAFWPDADRAPAARLLETSAEAAIVIERERALDAALAADSAPAVSAALTERVLADAALVASERTAAAAAEAPKATRQEERFSKRFGHALGAVFASLGGRGAALRLAGAATLAAAAGFVVGLETLSTSATNTATAAEQGELFAYATMSDEAVDDPLSSGFSAGLFAAENEDAL